MTDKTIKITDVPEGQWRERVLSMANAAKHAAWASGVQIPADHLLIRGAMLAEALATYTEAWTREGGLNANGIPADVALCMMAGSFNAEADDDRSDVARTLLATTLDDPWQTLAEACEDNRRLFGLDTGTGKREPTPITGEPPEINDAPTAPIELGKNNGE